MDRKKATEEEEEAEEERDVLHRRYRKLTELDCVNSNISRSSSSSISSDCACSLHTILQSSQVFVGRIKYHQVLRKKRV
jgi:hypothetical protein